MRTGQARQISRTLGAVGFPLAAIGFFLSHPDAATHAQSAAPAKAQEYVTCSAGTTQWLSAPRTVQLSDGVQFGQDDTTLKTDAAVALLGEDQKWISAKAQGPVHIYDPQDDLTGQHGSVDFTKHTATLRDNIILVVKPGKREANADRNSVRKQFKDPATLTCSEMTYDYKYKIGRIPGSLTVTQVVQAKGGSPQTRILTADAGLYNGKAQTIQLVGDIKITYSDGTVFQGDTRLKGEPVLISIKEGAESIFVPFTTTGHVPVTSQGDSGKDDSTDDGPDLTLPVPPPHTPGPGEAPASPQITPAPAAPRSQTLPSKAPLSPAQVPPNPAQTPPAAAAPPGSQ